MNANDRALFRPVVLIPCYNHPDTVGDVVRAVRARQLPVIVIDDGSDARTREACDALDTDAGVMVIHRKVNGGKGAAVMTGFKTAIARGFTHAVQIDADGQHDLADLATLLAVAHKHPDTLVCGYPVYDETVPAARRFGRKLTNFWVAVNALTLSVEDALCGFRCYPLARVKPLLAKDVKMGLRMDFDPEVLVRLLWQATPVLNVPVKVTYPLDGISHFDAWRDNVDISRMHAALFFGMLWRLPAIVWRRLATLLRSGA